MVANPPILRPALIHDFTRRYANHVLLTYTWRRAGRDPFGALSDWLRGVERWTVQVHTPLRLQPEDILRHLWKYDRPESNVFDHGGILGPVGHADSQVIAVAPAHDDLPDRQRVWLEIRRKAAA